MEQQEVGRLQISTFIQDLQNDIARCKNEEIIITTLNERKEVVKVHIEELGVSKYRFEQLQHTLDVQLYQEEASKIWNLMQDLIARFKSILIASKEIISVLQNYYTCYKRTQQLHAIGIEVDPSLVRIQDIRMLTNRILIVFSEISLVLQCTINTFNVQAAGNACELEICKSELDKLEIFIYKKFSLVVTQQPFQIMQLNSTSGVSLSVTLFNFNSSLTAPVPIEIFLINEPTAELIGFGEAIPDKLELCGTISEPKSEKKLKRRKKQEGESLKRQNLNYTSVNPFGTGSTGKSAKTGLRIENMISSPDGTEFTIQPGITVSKRLKTSGQGKYETVKEEKYCLLFVAELLIHNQIVKVWTTSLPVVISPHSSYNEGSWATVAWENAFPAPGRTGFQVQPTANVLKIYEMLKGLFKKLVGDELKTTHEKCILDKLKSLMDQPNDSNSICSEIPWSKIVGDGKTSFWCYFYRAAMIVTGHLQNAWRNGYIEGFISWEEAYPLLLRHNKPGTFLVRFSDSAPGSVSLVLHAFNGNVFRITPLEFYKHKDFADCVRPFLHQLNIVYRKSGEESFRWVYPDTCKKLAFETFYAEAEKLKLNMKPHYWRLLSILEGDAGDPAKNNGSAGVVATNETSSSLQSADHQLLNIAATHREFTGGNISNHIANTSSNPMEDSFDFEWLGGLIMDAENPA